MMIIMRNYADLLEAMGKNEEAKRFLVQAGGLNNLADIHNVTRNVVLTSPNLSQNSDKSSETK